MVIAELPHTAPATSWASTPAVRKVMQGNRSRDTRPELAIRTLLHAANRRYRVAFKPLAGVNRTIDIAFTRAKVAVFVDGCFWHGCPLHGHQPTTNASYWTPKIARNRARDADTTERLLQAGWTVLRFWEHELPDVVAQQVCRALDQQARRRG